MPRVISRASEEPTERAALLAAASTIAFASAATRSGRAEQDVAKAVHQAATGRRVGAERFAAPFAGGQRRAAAGPRLQLLVGGLAIDRLLVGRRRRPSR